jgi:RNA 2',3'-cyclic 3'-phosphodiesterase
MSTKLRAFFGLPVPEAAKPSLAAAIERMQKSAQGTLLSPRWQPADKFHATLKFLGWVETARLDELWSMALVFARVLPPLRAELTAVKSFGPPRRARVIVAALADKSGALARLAEALETGAEGLGFAREEREFRPHVTLARLKDPGNVTPWLDAAALEPAPITFPELCLYRSDLSPNGGIYTVLERLRLSGA